MIARTGSSAGSGLDAPLSPAQLREIAAKRQRARFGKVIDPSLEETHVHYRADAYDEPKRSLPDLAAWPIRAARWLNGFRCTIAAAPRTKKNHTTLGIRQSPAYRQYRDIVVNGFLPLVGLDLPLEDRPYNLAATFYVDRFGERADLIGLIQGLADALQNAGVVSDDRLFLSLDGCRVIAGDPAPRVDVLITELERR